MKKIVSLFLALCLCMCILPATFVSAAEGDMLVSYTFDDGLNGAYDSGNLSQTTEGFHLSGGKFLYDATQFTETKSRDIVFNHDNLEYKAITIEMEIAFEGALPAQTTYFNGRFGGEAGSNGVEFFKIYRTGGIAGTSTSLSAGRTYLISIELTPNGTGYDYTMYVNGASVKTGSFAKPSGLQMIVINFDNSTVGSNETRSMKMSIDNVFVIDGKRTSTMTINGASALYKAPSGISAAYPFSAEYEYAGETGSDGITWEITRNSDKVKVDANGNVSILDNSVASFEIKASKTIGTDVISAFKAVTLNNADVRDFEDGASFGTGTSVLTENGNKYLKATSGWTAFQHRLGSVEGIDYIVFESKVRIPETLTGLQNIFRTRVVDDNGTKWSYIQCRDGAVFVGTESIAVGYNKWFNLKIENNIKDGTYTMYVDGIQVNSEPYTATTKNIFKEDIRVEENFEYDDLKFYTAKLEQKINNISVENDVLYAPAVSGKSASTSFTATLKDNSFTPQWSLYGTYTGVEINRNTGKLTINKDVQASDLADNGLTVTAIATAGGIGKKHSITLYKAASDFSAQTVGEKPAGNWSNGYGIVAQDGSGNYYVEPQLQSNGNYDARYVVNSAIGNVVVEARVKLNSNGTSGRLFTYNQASGNGVNGLFDLTAESVGITNNDYYYSSIAVDTTQWFNIKAVLNVPANTTTVFVNGELLGASNIPMTASQTTTSVTQLIFRGLDVDDFKVYNISDTTPAAYNAYLENIAVGKASAPVYDYFDEGGQAEECSSYQWYIGSTADGSFDAISGATEKTYTPVAADLGKYIYVAITPASDESHTGATIETAPVKVGDIAIGEITYKVNGADKAINEIAIAKDGTEQTISLTMPARYTGSEPKDVMLLIGKYVNGQFSIVGYEKVTLTSADADITVSGTVAIPAADANKTVIKAFVWDGKLSPLFEIKNLK